jgi:hypothetical protein
MLKSLYNKIIIRHKWYCILNYWPIKVAESTQ